MHMHTTYLFSRIVVSFDHINNQLWIIENMQVLVAYFQGSIQTNVQSLNFNNMISVVKIQMLGHLVIFSIWKV